MEFVFCEDAEKKRKPLNVYLYEEWLIKQSQSNSLCFYFIFFFVQFTFWVGE